MLEAVRLVSLDFSVPEILRQILESDPINCIHGSFVYTWDSIPGVIRAPLQCCLVSEEFTQPDIRLEKPG